MQPLYTPKRGREGRTEPMRVMVFFSGGASSMKYMLENDTKHGRLYKVAAAFTDKPSAERGINLASQHDVPVVVFDRREFYKRKNLDPKIFDSRKFYYEEVLRKIEDFKPDVIALSGYMHIISDPLLDEYENRILNVHPADLSILKKRKGDRCLLPVEVFYAGKKGTKEVLEMIVSRGLERAYKGEDAVTDAVLNGEEFTKSTVHIATEHFDEGPILVQSKKFPVDTKFVSRKLRMRDWSSLVDYAHRLQEEMKWEGDGPAYAKAMEFVSQGRLAVDEFVVFLDGKELPYHGFQLEGHLNQEGDLII